MTSTLAHLKHNELWVVEKNPNDPWFRYFDFRSQFALSRDFNKFTESQNPWIMYIPQFLPAQALWLIDLNHSDAASRLKVWQNLGSPKTTVFSRSPQTHEFLSQAPERHTVVTEIP